MMQSDMAKLSVLILGLIFGLSVSEARSFPAIFPHSQEKASRDVSSPDKLEIVRNIPYKIHSLFARGPSDALDHLLKALSKRDFGDDQQQQQDVQPSSKSPCEEISRKLLLAREMFYGLMNDSVVPLIEAMADDDKVAVMQIITFLQLGSTFPPEYIESVICATINARTEAEILAAVGIPADSAMHQIYLENIEQTIIGIKRSNQYFNSDFLVPKLRSFVDLVQTFVKTLHAEGVQDPGPHKFIIPTLKNYYTSEELQELLVDLVDTYWDEVGGLVNLATSGPGQITPEMLKEHISQLAHAFIYADSPEEVGTALGFTLTPHGGRVLDGIVRFVLTLPDEAFETARLLVDILELTLDNMVLLQPTPEC